MSSKDGSDVHVDAAVKDENGGEKSAEQDEQLSPFHRITLSRSTDHTVHMSRIDSPRAVVPKIKKSAPTYKGTTTASDHPVPARRGRRAKNSSRKKTSETTVTSSNAETDNVTDEALAMTTDRFVSGSDKLSLSDERKRSGKSDLLSNGTVDGTAADESTTDGSQLVVSDAVSDIDQKQADCDAVAVKDRRCTSMPAGSYRKGGSRRKADESHKITEYFPIRRSSRMTTTELKKQELSDIQESIRSNRHDGLKVVDIPCKGRGVVTTRPFTKGEFVVEYAGDLVDLGIAKRREKSYSQNQHVGCYMYYFQHKTKNYCVDATAESGLLGRLVNHSRLKFNCATKVVEVDDQPRLIIVAARDIVINEELLYDYGDRSKESLEAYPWLAS